MRGKRPESLVSGKQVIVGLLVIALTHSVISAHGSSITTGEQPAAAAAAVSADQKSAQAGAEPKLEAPVATSGEQVAEAKKDAEAGASETRAESESARKGRAEAESAAAAATKEPAPKEAKDGEKQAVEKSTDSKSTKLEAKTSTPTKASKPSSSGSSAKLAGSKSKLSANLGTVTSTGSGGPAQYMSKHDAYSAIAEKHGPSNVVDAMHKSDKRGQSLQRFGGVQKASGGLGDVLSPFKGITDTGLARSLGASMRSIMKSKYSVPAYVASALLGAVALLAFYESPISPLPVPPLPEPPVGRFPPEMPNLSPNVQVPFRTNQQQQYNQQAYNNQRSFNPLGAYQQQQPQSQQVLFPGNAQQRQMAQAGPVQQLAANLANLAGKQQIAQRKSSPDYESSSRSFFGTSSGNSISPKIGAPANQQQKQNSFLSLFGLGASSSASSSGASNPAPSATAANSPAGADVQQAAGLSSSSQAGAASGSSTGAGSSSSLLEPKGQTSNGLSNSHVVNKVKSYFSRAPVSSASGSSSAAGISNTNSNPYDQYSRMSFVQALLKDTAFLPAFLAPNRKSSSSPTSSTSNKISSVTSALSSASANPNPSARMQVDSQYGSQLGSMIAASKQPVQKPSSGSSYGLARAADRIAHAFLETFTSGIMQRNAAPSVDSAADSAKKQSGEDYLGHPSLAAATTSLFTDLVSSYGSNAMESAGHHQQQQQQQYDQQAKSAVSQHQHSQQAGGQQQPAEGQVVSGRSDDQDHQQADQQKQQTKQQQVAAAAPPSTQSTASASDNSQAHVRKTRSIGLEYPIESNQNLALREQQHPSKASQINNVIDFVADSYSNNRLLFNFVMNQVGLSQAVPYVEQILASGANEHHHH